MQDGGREVGGKGKWGGGGRRRDAASRALKQYKCVGFILMVCA